MALQNTLHNSLLPVEHDPENNLPQAIDSSLRPTDIQ